MGIFEVISAIVLIIACVFIVVVVLMKETKTQMSQTISGSTSDSFFQKNAGRTKEAMLNKATVAAAIIFFVLALAVNVINSYWGGNSDNPEGDDTSIVLDTSDDDSDDTDNTNDSETSDNSDDEDSDTSDNSDDNSDEENDSDASDDAEDSETSDVE